MQRGGRKDEQIWRSDQEQRENGNGGVSSHGQVIRGVGGSDWVSGQVNRHGGQMWRGKRKDYWVEK